MGPMGRLDRERDAVDVCMRCGCAIAGFSLGGSEGARGGRGGPVLSCLGERVPWD
jgi:hypothetical protein